MLNFTIVSKNELKTDNSCCPRIGPDYIKDDDKHKNQLQLLQPTESNRIGPILMSKLGCSKNNIHIP